MIRKLIFAGYAPVHFVCFAPVYRRLVRMRGMEVFLSGELRSASNPTAEALYRPFRVRKDRVISLSEMRRRSFDMVFSAHVTGYFPRKDDARVQIFHGLSFRNMAVRGDVLVHDHLFMTGPYMLRQFERQRLLRPGDPRAIRIGFPKVDCLVSGELNRGQILKRLKITGRRPVVLYAPTGQKNNSLETGLGEEVVRRLRNLKRYDILVKPHDHPRDRSIDWKTRLRALQDRHTRVISDYDITPYLFVADLLITDASSVSSEFSVLDRPMVFLDVPELIASIRQRGRAVDEEWGRKGGPIVRWPDEAVDAVQWGLAHPNEYSKVRRAMASDLFYNLGHAGDVAVQWIRSYLDSGTEQRG